MQLERPATSAYFDLISICEKIMTEIHPVLYNTRHTANEACRGPDRTNYRHIVNYSFTTLYVDFSFVKG